MSISLIGGLSGQVVDSLFVNAYYAGTISINQNATDIRGLSGGIALSINSVIENVFWDSQVVGASEIVYEPPYGAPAGVAKTTAQMKKKGFWNRLGFDPHFWLIKTNQYPRLLGIDNIDVG